MKNKNKLFTSSILIAIYVATCFALAPISFGVIQFRVSELLCLLAIEFPFAIISNVIGCFIANLLFGLGIIDALFGSLATLFACYLAYCFRNKLYKGYPIISMLCIVVINALIVGIELGVIDQNIMMIPLAILQVGLGEFVVIFIIGLPIYHKFVTLFKKLIK